MSAKIAATGKLLLGSVSLPKTYSNSGWKARLFLTDRCSFRLSTIVFWWKTSMLKDWHLLDTSFKNAAVKERHYVFPGDRHVVFSGIREIS